MHLETRLGPARKGKRSDHVEPRRVVVTVVGEKAYRKLLDPERIPTSRPALHVFSLHVITRQTFSEVHAGQRPSGQPPAWRRACVRPRGLSSDRQGACVREFAGGRGEPKVINKF